jgi:hypothetical protein
MITQLSNGGYSTLVKRYVSDCQIRQDVNDIQLKVCDTNCVLIFFRAMEIDGLIIRYDK